MVLFRESPDGSRVEDERNWSMKENGLHNEPKRIFSVCQMKFTLGLLGCWTVASFKLCSATRTKQRRSGVPGTRSHATRGGGLWEELEGDTDRHPSFLFALQRVRYSTIKFSVCDELYSVVDVTYAGPS